MNIYLITQDFNNELDTYDAMVVIAKNEEDAKMLTIQDRAEDVEDTWAKIEYLKAHLLGKAVKGSKEKIVFQSYNNG